MTRMRPTVPVRNPFPPYTPPTITPTPNPRQNFRPVRIPTPTRSEPRTVTLTGAQGNVPLAYGRQRLGGEILFAHSQENIVLWLVVGLCRGEVDSFVSLTVNDKPAASYSPSLELNYWFHRGEAGQVVDPNLAAVLPSWNEPLAGICYGVVRLVVADGRWPSLPPQMQWEFKGLKCYDLANLAGPKVYSENLWVQDYNYMRHADGGALPEAAIHTADWITAAAVANEAMSDASKRYEYHALITDDVSVDDTLQQFCVAGDGYRYLDGEKYRLFLDRPAASSATLTDADLLRQAYSIERDDPFAKPNHVVVNFTDEADAWNEKPLPEEQKTAAAASGAEDLITATYNLPGIHRRGQARRKAIFFLNNLVFDAVLRRTARATGVSLLPGAVVTADLKAKGIVQDFRVIPVTKNPDHTYEVELLEYNAARYSDTVVTDTSRIKSTFPDQFATPPWPGLVVTTGKATSDGAQTTTWETIPVRSTAMWGAAYWSQVNCGTVTLANLNNGAYAVKALDFNVAGESIVKLDLGVGNAKTFREVIVSTGGAGVDWYVEYSDNDSAWTSVGMFDGSGLGPHLVNAAGANPDAAYLRIVCAFANVGSHRYWRLRQTASTAVAADVAEIQFYEWLGEWPYADSVVLCASGDDPATASVASEVPAVKSIATQELGHYTLTITGLNGSGYSGSGSQSSQLHVLSQAGLLGYGVAQEYSMAFMAQASTTGWAPDYLLHGQGALTLANGANNDVAVPSTVTLLRVTGPTGAFSLSGIVAKDGTNNTDEGGRLFVLVNASSQVMTLTHDATSTAANRLSCPDATDFTVASGRRVLLSYDSAASRWLVLPLSTATGDMTLAGAQTVTGEKTFTGNVKVGSSGVALKAILSFTSALDFFSTAEGGITQANISATGVASGDIIMGMDWYGYQFSNPGWYILGAFVASTNTITVIGINKTGGTNNPASTNITILVGDVT